jgi:hypothetical protein
MIASPGGGQVNTGRCRCGVTKEFIASFEAAPVKHTANAKRCKSCGISKPRLQKFYRYDGKVKAWFKICKSCEAGVKGAVLV